MNPLVSPLDNGDSSLQSRTEVARVMDALTTQRRRASGWNFIIIIVYGPSSLKFAQHAVPNKCLREHHQRHKENQPVIHDGFLLSWSLEDCTPMNDVERAEGNRHISRTVATKRDHQSWLPFSSEPPEESSIKLGSAGAVVEITTVPRWCVRCADVVVTLTTLHNSRMRPSAQE